MLTISSKLLSGWFSIVRTGVIGDVVLDDIQVSVAGLIDDRLIFVEEDIVLLGKEMFVAVGEELVEECKLLVVDSVVSSLKLLVVKTVVDITVVSVVVVIDIVAIFAVVGRVRMR